MSENCSGIDDCGSDGVSTPSIYEKGRNKRKYLSDLSLDIPVEVSSPSLTEFPRYEMMEEKIQNTLNELGSMMESSEGTVEEQDMEEFLQSDDWDDPVTCELEEMLSDALFSTFCTAANRIIERGYSKEVAEWAILQSSHFHGSADAISNLVDSALTILNREKEFNRPKHPVFEGLQNLVDYTLLEMVYVLREVRPSMTVSEAMWCLLKRDLNLVNACVAEGGALGGLSSLEAPAESETSAPSETENSGTSQSKDSNNSSSAKQKIFNDKGSQPETAARVSSNNSTSKQCPCELGKENSLFCEEAKGKLATIVWEHMQASSQAMSRDEKSARRGKCSSINSKRDMLRQKASEFEKNLKGRLLRGAFRARVAALGGVVKDKSLRSLSSSSSVAIKGARTKSATSVEGSNNLSSNLSPLVPASSVNDHVFALPAVNSETQASVPEPDSSSEEKVNVSETPKAIDYYASIPFDETLQKHIPQDEKEEAILMLLPHKKDIEKEIQGWTEWANEKVMEAARRLGKDKAELKMLRQEKDETEKCKKEKQTLEESAMKRLSEMESALTNATGQIEVANSNIRRLEKGNNMLKSDLEVAKVHALRAAANLHSAVLREQETLKKLQSWDAEKSLVQEQLKNLKRETPALYNQLEKMKERKDQFKALLNKEEKEKLKAQKQVDSSRRKLDEEAELMKVETEKIKQTAEEELQKCEGDIKNLQNMIAELRLESNKIKIAALNMGYRTHLPESQAITKRLSVFEDNFGKDPDVKPERECVMCMTDEISVIFIPCAHQVLCCQCNILHEKQGMNDCPSCRAPIQRRVSVSYRAD